MTKPTCLLCGKQKDLIKKSHIISDFLLKELYDENHKLFAFDPKELLKENPRISKPSTGSYEGGILCKDCDNGIIGIYETYVSKLLQQTLPKKNEVNCKQSKSSDGIVVIELDGLDYDKTKLFLLSILWRSHISSREEYRDVKLGPYAEKIRLQLLNERASPDSDIIISIIKFDEKAGFSTFIGQPIRHKIEHVTTYSIIINGYLIVYHLKENELSKKVNHHRLKENGTLTILEIPKKNTIPFILNYTGAIEKYKQKVINN